MESREKLRVLVVGAGPVGALAALYAAKRGHDVSVYELRNDLRDPTSTPLNFTKSINLAVSERGFNSLRQSGSPNLLQSILDETIPMYGRMIHGMKDGTLFEQSQQYDVEHRAIRAVDRFSLNKSLLEELDRMPNMKLMFNHKLTGADFKRNRAWFERREPWRKDAKNVEAKWRGRRASEIEVQFDFMIGADGAHSAARYHMMKYARVSLEQKYIDTIWCEFHMAPQMVDDKPEFRISPNHLHIWPGGSRMFIAIPSTDQSFTCTLFMSAAAFDAIDRDPETLIPFFQTNFPGVTPQLISEEEIREQYATNPHLPLTSLKCSPYHFGSSVAIIGDAAHAMVPFYGQGMNAGLEDVRVLFDILDSRPGAYSDPAIREQALCEYTNFRTPDAHTISDLAMGNYREMRARVLSPFYLLRKAIEERISVWFPRWGFMTQYTRVTFSNERYSEITTAVRRQEVLLESAAVGAATAMVFAGVIARYLWRQ